MRERERESEHPLTPPRMYKGLQNPFLPRVASEKGGSFGAALQDGATCGGGSGRGEDGLRLTAYG
jgi:hypothetical protein